MDLVIGPVDLASAASPVPNSDRGRRGTAIAIAATAARPVVNRLIRKAADVDIHVVIARAAR
jgi:hypothetical protein